MTGRTYRNLAAAVAVIAPPFFPLDDRSLEAHFTAAAAACAPLPFYLYEFEARSGRPARLPNATQAWF